MSNRLCVSRFRSEDNITAVDFLFVVVAFNFVGYSR